MQKYSKAFLAEKAKELSVPRDTLEKVFRAASFRFILQRRQPISTTKIPLLVTLHSLVLLQVAVL